MKKIIDKFCRHFGYVRSEEKWSGYPFGVAIVPYRTHMDFVDKLESENAYPVIVRPLVEFSDLKNGQDIVLRNKEEFMNYFHEWSEAERKRVEEKDFTQDRAENHVHICYRLVTLTNGKITRSSVLGKTTSQKD